MGTAATRNSVHTGTAITKRQCAYGFFVRGRDGLLLSSVRFPTITAATDCRTGAAVVLFCVVVMR